MARRQVHALRAAYDVVLTGSGTVLADDPLLTVRDAPLDGAPPLRAVIDRRGRVPSTAKLLNSPEGGPVEVFRQESIAAVLNVLESRGKTRVFLECGAELAAAFFRADLIDRIEWFRAPITIGADGIPALQNLGLTDLGEVRRFRLENVQRLGDDLWETYVRG